MPKSATYPCWVKTNASPLLIATVLSLFLLVAACGDSDGSGDGAQSVEPDDSATISDDDEASGNVSEGNVPEGNVSESETDPAESDGAPTETEPEADIESSGAATDAGGEVNADDANPDDADPGDAEEAAEEASGEEDDVEETGDANGASEEVAAGECGAGGPISDLRQTLELTTSDGAVRSYDLALPASYEEGTPSSVVFNMHGRGSNAFEQYVYGDFIDQAQADNVILVMPQAESRDGAVQWRAGAPGDGLDLDFLSELVAEVRANYCTDRFFAAGMSSGGGMASALACWAETPFEAFGPVTLAWYDRALCTEAGPRSFVYFHGTEDNTVPFIGNGQGLDAAPTTAREWAEHNNCDFDPVEERIGTEVVHFSWQNCDAPTDFYMVEGGSHTWPGALDIEALGYVTQEISASDLIWELFFG